jgi:hypothetical protein
MAVFHSEAEETVKVATDASGAYSMTLESRIYQVSASKRLYHTERVTGVEVCPGASAREDLVLTHLSDWCLANTCLYLPLYNHSE